MKNQMMKKLVCTVSAAAVLASGINAFAAQVVTGTDNYWSQTFEAAEAYKAPEEMFIQIDGAQTQADEAALTALKEQGTYLGGKTGLFGKSDAAFALEKAERSFVLKTADATMPDKSGLNPKSGGANGEYGNTTNYMHISVEMAVSDYSVTRQMQINTQDSGNGKNGITTPTTPVLTVEKDTGAVTLFGKSTAYTMPLNKWVRYDVVVYQIKDGKPVKPFAYIYADGKLIGSNIGFDGNAAVTGSGSSAFMFRALVGIYFTFENGENGCYIDNLTARRILGGNVSGEGTYAEKAAKIIQGLTLTNSAATVDNDTLTVTAPANMTAEALAAGFEGADVKIVKADGSAQSGALEAGYVIASGAIVTDDEFTDGDIYYTLALGAPVEDDDQVSLTITTDSGYYAETEDSAEKSGIVGFKTSVEKTGAPVILRYGTFLLKSTDFDTVEDPTTVSNLGDIASGAAFVAEVGNIGEADFGTSVYAKSFAETADGFFYSGIVGNTVNAGGKWLGARSAE